MFIKRPEQYGAAQAEAASLNWLGEASDHVAQVVEVAEGYLATDTIEQVVPTPDAAYRAGQELAQIHLAGAPAFGSPPPGWNGPYYIGTQEQPCIPTDDWLDFYAEQRVLNFAAKAVERKNLPASGYELVNDALEAMRERDWSHVKPARIHGDLWAGNLLFSANGPMFIDPAAHGGHPETDLAMLDLFGAPYIEEIHRGYNDVSPLPADYRAFTPLHQLHPLAVHALTHGPSYGIALMRAAGHVLEL